MQHYEVSIRDQLVDGVLRNPHCPNCGTGLERTGAGADALWECPHCGLAAFS
jgi:tRNA(Ile2) C34 agmatinyltransferase TiaS